MRQGLLFALALASLGAGLAVVPGLRVVGVILLLSALVICAGSLVVGLREREERSRLRRRKSFWIERSDGTRQRYTFAYVVGLPPRDRNELVANTPGMAKWYEHEVMGEAHELAAEVVTAGRLKRIWLRLSRPRDRFREP